MNKQKVEIVENLNIVNGGALKRVGALLIDLLLFVALMYLLSFVSTPILNATSDFKNKINNEQREMKRSYLVTLERELTAAELADDTILDGVNIKLNAVQSYEYAEATYKYYTLYVAANNTDTTLTYDDEWYLVNILAIDKEESPLKRTELPIENGKKRANDENTTSEEAESVPAFDPFLVPGTTYKVDEPDAEVLNKFYKSIYAAAIKSFENRASYIEVKRLINVDSIIRIVIASSVFFLVFPLFLNYGQTLGKKALKLGLATTYGYKITWWQALIRYFAFLFINILSNHLIIVLFPFISLTFMIFNKRGKAIHDFVAGTRVVDLNKSVIYDNPHAYLNSQTVTVTMVRDETINDEVFADRFREDSGA